MPPKKQVSATEEKSTTEKNTTTRTSKNKKIEIEKIIVDITDENVNEVILSTKIDDNVLNTNLNEDLEDTMPDKPFNLKTNSKFYICEDHYLNLDKTKFSEISNKDLTSLLFLRLLNSGNPLAKFVISIHRALVDPVNSNLQNLEGYRQALTNRTENTFRNKDKYNNKNRENNFENSQGFTRFRKFNNSDDHTNNVSREQMLTNSLEIESKHTFRRKFNNSDDHINNTLREQMITNPLEPENKQTYRKNFNRSRVNNE
jgi:hypothetical protein